MLTTQDVETPSYRATFNSSRELVRIDANGVTIVNDLTLDEARWIIEELALILRRQDQKMVATAKDAS